LTVEEGSTARARTTTAEASFIMSPMPGSVVSVSVAPGDLVLEGGELLCLESGAVYSSRAKLRPKRKEEKVEKVRSS
jgi:acetyl/propionyl-CoA carboxylase alpha subunit